MADAFILIKCDPSIVGRIRKKVHAAVPPGSALRDFPFRSDRIPSWFDSRTYGQLLTTLDAVDDLAWRVTKKYAEEQRRQVPKPVGARCTSCDRKIVTLTGKLPRLFQFMGRKGWKTLDLFLYCPDCAPADGTAPSIFSPSDMVAVNRNLLR